MKKLIGWAQTWSHSKIGWLANKAGLAFAAILGNVGLAAEDQTQQLVAALVAFITIALELGVKVSGDKLVGGIQSKFPRLKNDFWPGPETRSTIDSD